MEEEVSTIEEWRTDAEQLIDWYFEDGDGRRAIPQLAGMSPLRAAYCAVQLYREIKNNRADLPHGHPTAHFVTELREGRLTDSAAKNQ